MTIYSNGKEITVGEQNAITLEDVNDAIDAKLQDYGLLEEPQFEWWSPNMTSNTAPSPYVASGNWGSSGSASFGNAYYNAFDGDNFDSFWEGTDFTIWLQFDFGSKVLVNGVAIGPRNGYNKYCPNSFTLQGSNDGVNYTNLITVSGLADPANSTYRETTFKTRIKYRYYKFTDIVSGAYDGKPNNVQLGSVKFYIQTGSTPTAMFTTVQSGIESV